MLTLLALFLLFAIGAVYVAIIVLYVCGAAIMGIVLLLIAAVQKLLDRKEA